MLLLSQMVALHRSPVWVIISIPNERTIFMYSLLKWFSILQFISIPVLLVTAIWVGDLRYVWISIVTGLFSIFAGAYADTIAVARRLEEKNEQPSLF